MGTPTADLQDVPLTFRGEVVGRLLAAPRSPHDPFRPADRRLLADLARQLGVAVQATRLAARPAAVPGRPGGHREEERRRIRCELHDGLGPTLAGARWASMRCTGWPARALEQAADLGGQLKLEVERALADLRRVVEDLQPAALDELGLAAPCATSGQATEPVPGRDSGSPARTCRACRLRSRWRRSASPPRRSQRGTARCGAELPDPAPETTPTASGRDRGRRHRAAAGSSGGAV